MSIQIVREVSADVVKRGSTRAVYAKQGDYNSRFLNVRIQEDGNDITIDPDVGAEVILNVERPDRQEDAFLGSINEDGTVKVPLTSWMLALEGTLVCDISIVRKGEAKLTTMQFNIYVEAAVVTDETIEETEDYSVIVDLLARTNAAASAASEAAKNAATLKANCEEATQRANEVADDAEHIVNGYLGRIKEKNKGADLTFWVGTSEEYAALDSLDINNCLYIVTDDKTVENITTAVAGLQGAVGTLNQNVSSVAGSATANYSAIEDLKPKVSTLQGDVTDLQKAVSNLQTAYDNISFGAVLYDNSTGVKAGDRVNYNTSYNVYAVTISTTKLNVTIICSCTRNASVPAITDLIGEHSEVYLDGSRYTFSFRIENNVVSYCEWIASSGVGGSPTAAKITKIVGIV